MSHRTGPSDSPGPQHILPLDPQDWDRCLGGQSQLGAAWSQGLPQQTLCHLPDWGQEPSSGSQGLAGSENAEQLAASSPSSEPPLCHPKGPVTPNRVQGRAESPGGNVLRAQPRSPNRRACLSLHPGRPAPGGLLSQAPLWAPWEVRTELGKDGAEDKKGEREREIQPTTIY